MPYKNPAKRMEYQREWYAARRAKGIELLGGKCVLCGATEELELDHIDPATKFTHRIFSYNWNKINEELAKCQLLCVPCHFEKTLVFISTAGGTWATRRNHHKKGCGCRACREMRSAEVGVVLKSRVEIKSGAIKSREPEMAYARITEEEIWKD